jgi:predicted outer membrane protein
MSPLIRRVAAVAAGAIAALVVSSAPAQADGAGPLNAADMTLLIGLRQAALWEIPAAKAVAERGSTAKIRQAAEKLAAAQSQLDRQTVDVIAKLDATVRPALTAEQQGVLNQLQESATGSQYDRLFVNSLRNGYGFLYTIIGEVRSSTRVALIRQLADQANVAFLSYMQTLENTGLVEARSLAPAAIPPAQDLSTLGMAKANAGVTSPISVAVLWLLAIAAAGLAAIVGLRIARSRRSTADLRFVVRRD